MEWAVPQWISFAVLLVASLGAAIVFFVMGYRAGRRRASHVVFLPAGQPIPMSSEHWERIAEESREVPEEEDGLARKGLRRVVRFIFKAVVVLLAIIGIAALTTC